MTAETNRLQLEDPEAEALLSKLVDLMTSISDGRDDGIDLIEEAINHVIDRAMERQRPGSSTRTLH